MKSIFTITFIGLIFTTFLTTGISSAKTLEVDVNPVLDGLKNYQVNTPIMHSSGLPNTEQFSALKALGVTKVIDLIPGDRTEEIRLMKLMDLRYHNIQVDWDNPTVENFNDYALILKQSNDIEGITLTHCRLNWRGAVFTYLYRVTQLNEPEELAKQDLDAIWEPNETWQIFIDNVKANK